MFYNSLAKILPPLLHKRREEYNNLDCDRPQDKQVIGKGHELSCTLYPAVLSTKVFEGLIETENGVVEEVMV